MRFIQFPYTILNGELLSCEKKISVKAKLIDVIGTRTGDVIDGIDYVSKTAFYIIYNGNCYGSETMTHNAFSTLINRCCGNLITVKMYNLNGDEIKDYPVGVFNADGNLLGIANSQAEYIALWESDPLNQLQGAITAGSKPTQFKLPDTATVSGVIGLRFWKVDVEANKIFRVLVDTNDVVLYPDGNIISGATSTLLSRTDTASIYGNASGIDNNRALLNSKAITGTSTSSGTVYVFHNDTAATTGFLDAQYLPLSFPAGHATNYGGVLPKRTEQIVLNVRQGATNRFSSITNWNELVKTRSLLFLNRTDNFGGNDLSTFPLFKHMKDLEYIFNTYSKIPPTIYGLNDKAIFPKLTSLIWATPYQSSFPIGSFANVSNKLKVFWTGNGTFGNTGNTTAALNDQLFIDLDANVTNIPATILINPAINIGGGQGRTGASNAAYSSIISKGFGIAII